MSHSESQDAPTPRAAKSKRATPPDTLEERLASTLYLAGEAIAPVPEMEAAHHAEPEDKRDAPLIEDFDWLKDLIAHFRRTLAQDPKRAELLRLLPQGYGDGDILRVLFCNLFPQQKDKRKLYRDDNGKPKLSPVQIEILREAATGASYKEIAARRKCSYVNVTSHMQLIFRKLNAGSLQEAAATAISMGYLPLDVLDFVNGAGKCSVKDYSVLDSMLSCLTEIEKVADPASWQELAAFGLMLMTVCGTAIGPQTHAAEKLPTNGVLLCLEPQPDGTYRAWQVVGTGQIRYPSGIAIVPPVARREGFTPGSVLVVHNRATIAGRNIQEIMEFTPQGRFVRTFCGARAQKTSLRGTYGLTFTPSGALLATSDNALLRFTEGGRVVQWLVDGCCTDVCTDRQENLYVAHYSSRGGSIHSFTRRGKPLREFAQQPPGAAFTTLHMTASGEIAALCFDDGSNQDPSSVMMQFYSTEGEPLRCWRVPDGVHVSFALDAKANRLYFPNHLTKAIHVYSLDGTPQQTIALDARFTPSFIALGSDGALWLSGVVEEA